MIPIGYEVNFDGIIGPTHNYSGLSYVNIASIKSGGTVSNPLKAALQGLDKMKLFMDLGLKQGLLPPHERPHIPTLRSLGFSGADRLIPQKAYEAAPWILFNVSSASSAWTANSGLITPSVDAIDNTVHITPANLAGKAHRCIESDFTARIFKKIFPDPLYFRHSPPLPMGPIFFDEGAANHLRLSVKHMQRGIHIFVFGTTVMAGAFNINPKIFPPRQSNEASAALARLHKIFPERVLLIKQNPWAIDKGAFHNDLVAVANEHLLFLHEEAFVNTSAVVDDIKKTMKTYLDNELFLIKVSDADISLERALSSYLFNSQIVTLPDESMAIFAPIECQNDDKIFLFLKGLISDPENPIKDLRFLDVEESMRNGGGPACLRIRAQLTQNELNALHPRAILTEKLYDKLLSWVRKHYRDRLLPDDLRDPELVDETQRALDELTEILNLGSVYSFQR